MPRDSMLSVVCGGCLWYQIWEPECWLIQFHSKQYFHLCPISPAPEEIFGPPHQMILSHTSPM